VWTFVQPGEEMASGGPPSTGQQRAADGRETLLERSRALLEPNRRAAEQYAAGGRPDGEDAVRVWNSPRPCQPAPRLGEGPLTVWAEDDILHVLWRGQADEVQLVAGLQPWLWPVQGTRDLVGGVASPLPAG
jgi:hypothetical protein